MKLNRNNLSLSILVSMLIVNLLMIFNLNYLCIRAILAFIFIITIPGLLIMLCLKIREVGFWEYLVYTIGLSVAFIMFGGLAVNWTLPFLHITDKPLSLYPILICFDIFLVALGFVAYKRNKDLDFQPKFPKFSWLDRFFILWAFCFPFMAVIGAFLLNNHGTNLVTMIMLGMIAVYVFLVVLLRDKLNENVFPWALWMIGLSLLLMFSMRSEYVVGGDIVAEFKMFQFTYQNSQWKMSYFPEHPYNACVSLTILPSIILTFLQTNPYIIFKIFTNIIYSFVPVVLFLICSKHTTRLFSFLGGFFFISFIGFLVSSPMHARQEISFLFFGLILLIILSREVSSITRNLLFVIFGFSMIISHYSTSYIALAIFASTYLCIFFYKKYENSKIKKGKMQKHEKENFYLTGALLLLLLIFGFLWYAQLTQTTGGLEKVLSETVSKLNGAINRESSISLESDNRILSKFFESSRDKYYQELEVPNYPNPPTIFYPHPTSKNFNFGQSFYSALLFTNRNIDNLFKAFAIIGFLIILFLSNKNFDKTYLIISFIFIIVLILMRLAPITGFNYDPMRLHYQSLFLLALPVILFLPILFNKFSKSIVYPLLVLFLILYFLFNAGFVIQIFGGDEPAPQLNNFGLSYQIWTTQKSDLSSANWLVKNEDEKSKLVINSYTFIKYPYIVDPFNRRVITGVIPQTVTKGSYVYSDYFNKIFGVGFIGSSGKDVSYNFPTDFLNDNKNKIYNNGGSEIFK
jgi:uncharacterized membrane protein